MNGLLGWSNSINPVRIEVDGEIRTKPVDMADYLLTILNQRQTSIGLI